MINNKVQIFQKNKLLYFDREKSFDSIFNQEDIQETASSNGLNFICTRNLNLLADYCRFREISYKKILGLQNFSGKLDETDSRSLFIFAVKDSNCIAGARITFNDPNLRYSLPIEDESYILTDIFPELSLPESRYCEISRLAIDLELISNLADEFYYFMFQKIIKLDMGYVFTVAAKSHTKRFLPMQKKSFNKLLYTEIPLPQKTIYEKNKMYLTIFKV